MGRLVVTIERLRHLIHKLNHTILWCGTHDVHRVMVDTVMNSKKYKYLIDLRYEYDTLPYTDVVRNGEADVAGLTVAFVPTNVDFFAPLRKASALGVNAGGSCYPGSGNPASIEERCVCGYDIELNMSGHGKGEFPMPDVSILSCALWCSCGYRAFLTSMDMNGDSITGSLQSCDIVSLTIDMVKEHSPQWLVGWNNFAFDNLCMHYHAVEPYKSMFKQVKTGSASTIDYGYILDIEGVYNADPYCYFYRSPGHNYDDMSLAGVAAKEGVIAKKDMPNLEGFGDPYEIMDYNMTDSAAAAQIWMSTGMTDEIFNLSVCSCAPVYDCVRYMTGAIWGMAISSECIKEMKIMDWSVSTREVEYAGGMVLDPVLGVHSDVIIVDFSSMYPTIMIDGHISSESVTVVECTDREYGEVWWDDQTTYVSLGTCAGTFPREASDIQGRVLHKMVTTRKKYKKSRPKYANALKITSNSGYGALGYPNSPMYSPVCSACVTAVGRWFLRMASEIFANCGLRVLYGDTDSCMIGGTEVTMTKYGGDVMKHYQAVSRVLKVSIEATPFKNMDMSFESYHPRMLFLGKKKYCKMNVDGSVVYKGVSVVRSDTLGVVKHCLRTVSGILMNNTDTVMVTNMIARYVCIVVELARCRKLTAWDVSKVRKQDGRKCYVYKDVAGVEQYVPVDLGVNVVHDYDVAAVLKAFRDELLRLCGACGLPSLDRMLMNSTVFI